MDIGTRQRLINSIINHSYTDKKNLKVGIIAMEAGITRQSLHRYYGDLLGYIKGQKDVENLLPATEQDSVTQLLVQSQRRVRSLEEKLAGIESRHKDELKTTLNNHITSLMNNDITLFEADEVRASLEQQSSLIHNYVDQINQLKSELLKITLSSTLTPTNKGIGRRIILEPKLQEAWGIYKQDGNYDAYLDAKDKELNKILSKINNFTGNVNLVVFLERHISDFNQFIESLSPPATTQIVVRAPLYTSIEVKNFIKKISATGTKYVHIPECLSRAEASAQRSFRAASVPSEELENSEKAETVHLFKGLDHVTYFTVTLGK